MADISMKLEELIGKRKWKNVDEAAGKLRISRAALYNYIGKRDLASFELLKRVHDEWGVDFTYLNFGAPAKKRYPSEADEPRQYVLPFIESVRQDDIQIIRAKPVRPDTLELVVRIRFAG